MNATDMPAARRKHASLSVLNIEQQAKLGHEISIPWQRESIILGQCFESSAASDSDPWRQTNPWDPDSEQISLKFFPLKEGAGKGSYSFINTTSSNSSLDHLSLAFGVSVGCDFLDVGVRGRFDKKVLDNTDVFKLSLHASHVAGIVHFERPPQLSEKALRLLRESRAEVFRKTYGDYYVGGFELGAESGIFCSMSGDYRERTSDINIDVQGKFLFLKGSENLYHEETFERLAEAKWRLACYDTMTDEYLDLPNAAGHVAQEKARSHSARCSWLGEEFNRAMKPWSGASERRSHLSIRECEDLSRSGLVLSLLLLPFSKMREYKATVKQRARSIAELQL